MTAASMISRLVAGGFALLVLLALPAAAGDIGGEITISCENGHTYSLVPTAVSDAGDIVTARLYTSAHHSIRVRLIPMGSGYRYAGRGVWLDGIRGEGVLNFGKSVAIACGVSPIFVSDVW